MQHCSYFWKGTMVWSTDTSNRSVVGMKMMETGNLVLYDSSNNTVWKSFDHPTDTLLPGQKLVAGQRLMASVSENNVSEGSLYLKSKDDREIVYNFSIDGNIRSIDFSYYGAVNGSLALYILLGDIPMAYLRFDPDGHFRAYDNNMDELVDLLDMHGCNYPTYCGHYGVCSNEKFSCSIDQDKEGCSDYNQTTCQKPQALSLNSISDIYYFNFIDSDAAFMKGTDARSCKEASFKNSCKAALFQYAHSLSDGNCFLPSPALSLIDDRKGTNLYKSYAFIQIYKDTKISSDGEGGRRSTTSAIRTKVAASTVGAILLVSLIVGFWIRLLCKKKDGEEGMEDCFDQISDMPMRFTYEELKAATGDFHKKLGEGGFGSVFEGSMKNGEKIAVKRLHAFGQGMKEFLAEVKTIGNIHHVNLVRLIGFCAEKMHRLLVYGFMCNGSLDKWIFYKEPLQPSLDWKTRRSIILDVAKGLAYLHEECRQRIVHLDIKPQNILLDTSLHARISDFGLSKLIDKDQSQVETTMRGTPGYMAPEWFSSVITEKVDVYSFGIVIMEMVCGRKNLDRSQPRESMHLLAVFMKKAEEDQLIDMVDKHSEDMQLHHSEVMEMMRVAIWCLQCDFTRRPSMSTVVKVLEGVVEVEADLDYSILNPTTMAAKRSLVEFVTTATLSPSLLSGPR